MKKVIFGSVLFAGVSLISLLSAQEIINTTEDGKKVYTSEGEVLGLNNFDIDASPAYDPFMNEISNGEEPTAPTVSSSPGVPAESQFNEDAYNPSDPYMGHTNKELPKSEILGEDLHSGYPE